MRNIFGFFTMLGFLGILGVMCVASGALGIEGVKQFDALDFSAVGTRSTAIPAAPAAFESVPGPSATPTAYAPPAELAVPAEAAQSGVGVVTSDGAIAMSVDESSDPDNPRVTYFRYVADLGAEKYQIPSGTYLKLEFELEGMDGWYGVEWLGYRGYVRMAEIDLPDGLYTWDDLSALLPRRAGW